LISGKDVGHGNFVLRVLAVERSHSEHDALEGQARLGDAWCADGISVFETKASIVPTHGRQQIDGEVRTCEIRGARRDEQRQRGKRLESASAAQGHLANGTVFTHGQNDITGSKRFEGELGSVAWAHDVSGWSHDLPRRVRQKGAAED